jgi:hypothetical protein
MDHLARRDVSAAHRMSCQKYLKILLMLNKI